MTDARPEAAYLVCGTKPWNRRVFDEILSGYPGSWHYLDDSEALTVDTLEKLAPRYVFFLHWSSKVPAEIIGAYECINFHMTDVPYGRGGSPLQNLILRGHAETKLSALRMTDEIDAGPVFLKRELSLAGTAQEILERATELAAEMIREILEGEIEPEPQRGDVTVFRRRRPEESEIPDDLTPEALYDFIRMLDGEGYPPAFIRAGGYRYELRDAILQEGRLRATVTVVPDRRRVNRPSDRQ